jgi:hypothetical protein
MLEMFQGTLSLEGGLGWMNEFLLDETSTKLLLDKNWKDDFWFFGWTEVVI